MEGQTGDLHTCHPTNPVPYFQRGLLALLPLPTHLPGNVKVRPASLRLFWPLKITTFSFSDVHGDRVKVLSPFDCLFLHYYACFRSPTFMEYTIVPL